MYCPLLKYMFKYIHTLIFSTLLFYQNIFCITSDSISINWGIRGGYSQSTHKANFVNLPSVPNCCIPFGNSSGNSFNLGVFFNTKIYSILYSQLSINYQDLSANLKAQEFIGYAEYNSKPVEVYSIHTLNANLGYFSFNPELQIKPLNIIPLKLGVGVDLGFLLPKSFKQQEELDPLSISRSFSYFDGTKQTTVKNVQSGSLPVSAIYSLLNFSANYQIFLFNNFSITPEIRYALGLKNIIKTIEWRINTLSFNVAVNFSPITFNYGTKEQLLIEPIKEPKNEIVAKKDIDTLEIILLNAEKPELKSKSLASDTIIKKETIIQNINDELNKLTISEHGKCFKVILLSSPNKKQIQRYFNKLQRSKIIEFKIELWFNESNNNQYYRIISDCFGESEDASNFKNNMADRVLKLIPDAKMYIKFENK
jgi:hypothetical protein